jgi:hypothetical protein
VPKLVQKKEIVQQQITATALFCFPGTSAENKKSKKAGKYGIGNSFNPIICILQPYKISTDNYFDYLTNPLLLYNYHRLP